MEWNNDGFYSHILLARLRFGDIQGPLFSAPQSQWLEKIYPIIEEVVSANPDLNINTLHRINANLVHGGNELMTPPLPGPPVPSLEHADLLDRCRGTYYTYRRIVQRDRFIPSQRGRHCLSSGGMMSSSKGRRIVILLLRFPNNVADTI